MSCLEFHRMCAEDPARGEPDFLEHLRSCGGCGHHHAEALAFDRRLARALLVDAPRGMHPRVCIEQRLRRRRWTRPAWAAAALTLIGAGAMMWPSGEALGDDLVHHVLDEPEALAAREPAPPDALRAVLASAGVDGDLDDVVYAGSCNLDGQRGGHLVLRHGDELVSVLLLPDRHAVGTFEERGLHGRFLRAGWGTAAVIGSEAVVDDFSASPPLALLGWTEG